MSKSEYKHIQDIDGVLTIRADEALVCSDVHVPGQHDTYIDKMINYGKEHKIKHLFIAGDFWNFDAISRWEIKDRNLTFGEELKIGRALLERLTKHFYVYMVTGNHDARLPKILQYSISFSDWMATVIAKKVIVTDYDYLYLDSNGKKFRICHPSLYSIIKGRQVSLLAQDLQENIIMGHQHFFSYSTNKTGQYICIDSGCMCDKDAFVYKRSSTNRCPEWENGFIHIKNGKVKLLSDFNF